MESMREKRFRVQGSGFRAQKAFGATDPPGAARCKSRREFLQKVGGLTAGAAFAHLVGKSAVALDGDVAATLPATRALPSIGPIDPRIKSIVAHVVRKEVIDGPKSHMTLLGEMIEEGLRITTGENNAVDAWRKLLKPDDVIGIKFNQVGANELGTTLPMATALVSSLKRAGFAPERVMLIEAPHRLTRELKTKRPVFGWSGTAVSFGSGAEELSAVLQEVTALINVPFLKTHNIAGMSGCLKNLSHAFIRRPARYHGNGCAPYVGDIVALDQIRSKLRIHIVNALRVVYQGGPTVVPEGVWTHAGLIVSTDPVAADATGIDLLNEQRARAKLPPIGDDQAHIPHVHAAAQRGLGTDDQDYIQVIQPPPL